MRFHYCPKCGEALSFRDLGDDKDVPWCGRCSRPWFDMFSSCVIVLVHNERNEVMLLEQQYISSQYRNLVSGYIQPGETAEEAACREVLEETGITISQLEFAGTYWFAKKGMMMIGFIASAEAGDDAPRLSSEVDGAGWYDAAEAPGLVHPKGSVSHTLCDLFLNNTKKHSSS